MRTLHRFVVPAIASTVLLFSPFAIAQTCASNRNVSWDWTVPVAQTVYLNGPSGVTARAVNLPYYDVTGFATNLNIPSGPDVFPSDGWKLLYRSFGNPTCGVNIPYFILYNRFNGILRLFFYNDITNQTFSSGKITLAETSASNAPLAAAPLLSFDGGDATHPLVTVNSVGPDFWSYADFSLTAFDLSPVLDSTLEFTIDGVTTTNLQLTGSVTLDQVLSQANVAGTVDPTGAVKAADADYRTFQAARTDLNKAATAKGNQGTWWAPVASTLASGANLVSGISAIAGFISSFLGGGKSQAPPMHFQGQIQATGTLTTQLNLTQMIMRVPGAPHSSSTDDALPFSDAALGVFKIDIPVIDSFYERGNCGFSITCAVANGKVFESETPLIVHLNPSATTGATFYVTWGWTFFNQAPSFGPETLATSNTINLDLGGRFTTDPSGILIKLRIIPASAPLGQDPVVVLKTFPITSKFLGIQ